MTPVSASPRRERIEPLWDRVDRNRLALTGFVIAFVGASVVGLDLYLGLPILLLGLVRLASGISLAETLAGVSYLLLPASAVLALIVGGWAAFTLLRSEKWLVKRLGATLVPTGELMDTKFALKDMAIAAGLPVAPALYLLPTSGTNAFVFAARRRRAVIGVTKGFTTKLTTDEQRAVFANLVARLVSGDSIVSTGVTALMWPLHAWRASRLTADDDELERATTGGSSAAAYSERSAEAFVLFFLLGVGFAILAEIVAAGHRRAQLSTAEKADAEGMLLLKDPASMLAALERCVELDNVVPSAGEAFAELFYCWTGDATSDEDDPEWQRVARLREVLGVMGFTAPAVASQGEGADALLPPHAPRIDDPIVS